MALTPTAVCNMALANIGETVKLANYLTDTTPAGKACQTWWDVVAAIAGSRHPWIFATTQKALVESPASSRSGWDYTYALPTYCLRPLAILIEGQRFEALSRDERAAYEVFSSLEGGPIDRIACGVPPTDAPVLEYVVQVTAVQNWPMPYAEGVAYLLGAKLALALKKDVKLASTMMSAGWDTLKQAHADELAGQETGDESETPSISARGT